MKKIDNILKLIAVLVAVAVITVPVDDVSASRKTSLTSKINQQKSIEKQLKQVQAQIRQKQKERKSALDVLMEADVERELAQSKLAQNSLQLQYAEFDLKRTTERLERTIKQLQRRQELLSSRVVDIYEGEDLGYADVVLGSGDMWTFLSRAYYLEQILNSDTALIKQINADKEAIEQDKARKEQRVAEVKDLHAKLIKERNRVAALAEKRQQAVDIIENSIEAFEEAEARLERDSQAIEAWIQQYSTTSAGQASSAKVFKGGFIMPVNGRRTSNFGYRTHPITGVYKLHTGVDFGARSGTPIKAAASGTVIKAGWMGAYGNAVIVDHGGGVSTLYGHCSRLACSSGKRVSQGQVIGYVGSTGYSTGPHLHFEKRINGKPVNPL